MATAKKLDTFVLRDKFRLESDTIIQEAQASAVRRSEVMGWEDVSVRASDAVPTTDGEYTCYAFEIWGVAAAPILIGESTPESGDSQADKGIAAREVNP